MDINWNLEVSQKVNKEEIQNHRRKLKEGNPKIKVGGHRENHRIGAKKQRKSSCKSTKPATHQRDWSVQNLNPKDNVAIQG